MSRRIQLAAWAVFSALLLCNFGCAVFGPWLSWKRIFEAVAMGAIFD